jgi:hypothetical protein
MGFTLTQRVSPNHLHSWHWKKLTQELTYAVEEELDIATHMSCNKSNCTYTICERVDGDLESRWQWSYMFITYALSHVLPHDPFCSCE